MPILFPRIFTQPVVELVASFKPSYFEIVDLSYSNYYKTSLTLPINISQVAY